MVDLEGLAVDGFGHWLAGFVDGEGCFQIAGKTVAGGTTYHAKMEITLRDDDGEILHVASERTGLGSVAYNVTRQPGCRDIVRWTVRTRADVWELCRLLDRFPLRAKKQADYEVWREAVVYWLNIRSGGSRGALGIAVRAANDPIFARMADLQRQLREVRAYAFA